MLDGKAVCRLGNKACVIAFVLSTVTILVCFTQSGTSLRGQYIQTALYNDMKYSRELPRLQAIANTICITMENTCLSGVMASAKPPCTTSPRDVYDGCWGTFNGSIKFFPRSCELMSTDNIISHLQKRFGHLENSWIYFLGDSSTRGLYCHLAMYTLAGSKEHNLTSIGCDPPVSTKGAESELSFSLPLRNSSSLKISYTYSYEMADTMSTRFLMNMMRQEQQPDVILYNSGAWEQVLKWDALGTNVSTLRAVAARTIISILKVNEYRGMFIYRNSICNKRFNAQLYDLLLEDVFRAEGYTVLDAHALSIGRVNDSTWDGFHMDKTLGNYRSKWEAMPNIGRLNDAILLAFLSEIGQGLYSL